MNIHQVFRRSRIHLEGAIPGPGGVYRGPTFRFCGYCSGWTELPARLCDGCGAPIPYTPPAGPERPGIERRGRPDDGGPSSPG